jgi:transcription initiation factor TFIID subunit TAF12
MGAAEAAAMEASVKGSALYAKYAEVVNSESAAEKLGKAAEESAKAQAEQAQAEQKRADAPAAKQSGSTRKRGRSGAIADAAWSSADDIAAALAPRGKKQLARNVTNILKGVFRRR